MLLWQDLLSTLPLPLFARISMGSSRGSMEPHVLFDSLVNRSRLSSALWRGTASNANDEPDLSKKICGTCLPRLSMRGSHRFSIFPPSDVIRLVLIGTRTRPFSGSHDRKENSFGHIQSKVWLTGVHTSSFFKGNLNWDEMRSRLEPQLTSRGYTVSFVNPLLMTPKDQILLFSGGPYLYHLMVLE